MARVFTQSFKFTAAQTAIRAIASEVKASVNWVKQLNDALNDIAVVTGKTPDQMAKMTQNTITAARDLRVAAKEYAEGALIFYQQGLGDTEVAQRTEITIKAAKAANQSVSEMSSQLTAIWNTYGMIGAEQERAAAVGAKLASETAVNFADIAEAMQSTASAAATMGVSYDSLAAIIATVGDTTQQSASVIGNAYKTIFSRMEQLKIEGTDGEVTLNSVSETLHKMGIEVLDSAGNLKALDDVIMELGNDWDKYTNAQRVAIAEQIGGTRQYTQFMALMNNFDKYLKNMNMAKTEDGSTLEKQYTQALDSIESRAENAAEAWKRAFANAIPADLIKTVYAATEHLGNAVGGLIKGLGGLPGILTFAATALSSKIVPAITNAAAQAKLLWQNMSPKGRIDGINKEFDANAAAINDQKSKFKNNSLIQQDLVIAQKKNEFSRQTALINEQINTALRTASGQYKLQLEFQQQMLQSAQDLYQKSLDENRNLETQNRQRQETLDLIIEENALRQEMLDAEVAAAQRNVENKRADVD